jgi:hypothetical protein
MKPTKRGPCVSCADTCFSFFCQQFVDAAVLECRSIATRAGLAAHEIPVSFHVEIEPWSVRIVMFCSWSSSTFNCLDRFKTEC